MEIHYIRMGDYYIPDLMLPEESRPIGKWGRMNRDYLKEHKPIRYNCLLLSGKPNFNSPEKADSQGCFVFKRA